MKILSIDVYHYLRGGAETVFLNTSQLLEEHGHSVSRFALKWDENMPSPYSRYFPESKDTRKGPFRALKNIVTYFYHFEAARKLDRLLRDERPDLAHVHLIWGQLTPSILRVLRRHKVPVVLTAHDYRIVCPAYAFRNGRGEICEKCHGTNFWHCIGGNCCRGNKPLSAMMAAEQYFRNTFFHPAKMLDGIIYVSDFCRNKHEQYMPRLRELPAMRLYNMAMNILPEPAPRAAEPFYLFLGRLSQEKGIETIIAAFSRMPYLRVKIAGRGPLEAELKKKAESLGLANVEFLGFKSGAELQQLTAEAKALILPSRCYENNPMTVIEAYSAGTPAIGAEIGGIPEIVVDGMTGFRFESGDPDSLVEALNKMETLDPEEYGRMQHAALDFARENFSLDQYYQRLIGFYQRVIDASHPTCH
ncbi:MAG: glycosyltransferase family 4 protein [Muribaculaceae bacterium]|nr:glycosyltransferase family 4 protein [Muribaculaceae bacterium]